MALTELETRITSAIDAVGPAVVAVESLRLVRRRRWEGPFGAQAQASAFVIDPAGYLVTNQHVVDGAARLNVELSDGRELIGEVVGGDPVTDLAVVKVDATDLPAVRLGNSEELRVGQIVLAIGNALGLPGGPTVSTGVVSALGRPLPGSDFVFEGLIQTDAAINPGNSGGPLVDLSGTVVGVNTAMMPFAQGVGFAIPIHAVARIADELRSKGRIVRPWMGVTVAELRPEVALRYGLEVGSGLLVGDVAPRSPAHKAGLKAGDVVTRVGPKEVRSVRDLVGALSSYPVGTDVEVGYRRKGSAYATNVPLQETPEAVAADE
ncbi:MAG TPA: trypsin-like peptidase domain-containing protein [Thermoplasmata archaeon]|nr:trypsin-like peptidase domain-containing protein [Thermoplasmata archaeon]